LQAFAATPLFSVARCVPIVYTVGMVKNETTKGETMNEKLMALVDHILAMDGDAYLDGHPEFNALVEEAQRIKEEISAPKDN
jgi:hypothetical protein